jgi:hypothetical protein
MLNAHTQAKNAIQRPIKTNRAASFRRAVLHRDLTLSVLPFVRSNRNHAEELHHLQRRSIAGYHAPVLRSVPVSPILFQGLSEERLEGAA